MGGVQEANGDTEMERELPQCGSGICCPEQQYLSRAGACRRSVL